MSSSNDVDVLHRRVDELTRLNHELTRKHDDAQKRIQQLMKPGGRGQEQERKEKENLEKLKVARSEKKKLEEEYKNEKNSLMTRITQLEKQVDDSKMAYSLLSSSHSQLLSSFSSLTNERSALSGAIDSIKLNNEQEKEEIIAMWHERHKQLAERYELMDAECQQLRKKAKDAKDKQERDSIANRMELNNVKLTLSRVQTHQKIYIKLIKVLLMRNYVRSWRIRRLVFNLHLKVSEMIVERYEEKREDGEEEEVPMELLRKEKKKALDEMKNRGMSALSMLYSLCDEIETLQPSVAEMHSSLLAQRQTIQAFFQRNIQLSTKCINLKKALEQQEKNYETLKKLMYKKQDEREQDVILLRAFASNIHQKSVGQSTHGATNHAAATASASASFRRRSATLDEKQQVEFENDNIKLPSKHNNSTQQATSPSSASHTANSTHSSEPPYASFGSSTSPNSSQHGIEEPASHSRNSSHNQAQAQRPSTAAATTTTTATTAPSNYRSFLPQGMVSASSSSHTTPSNSAQTSLSQPAQTTTTTAGATIQPRPPTAPSPYAAAGATQPAQPPPSSSQTAAPSTFAPQQPLVNNLTSAPTTTTQPATSPSSSPSLGPSLSLGYSPYSHPTHLSPPVLYPAGMSPWTPSLPWAPATVMRAPTYRPAQHSGPTMYNGPTLNNNNHNNNNNNNNSSLSANANISAQYHTSMLPNIVNSNQSYLQPSSFSANPNNMMIR